MPKKHYKDLCFFFLLEIPDEWTARLRYRVPLFGTTTSTDTMRIPISTANLSSPKIDDAVKRKKAMLF